MSRSKTIRVLGSSDEGLQVVAGVYRCFETYGLPLDVLFFTLKERRMVPHWPSFYEEALQAGMKHERILSKLDEALCDVYGKNVRDSVIEGLEQHRK